MLKFLYSFIAIIILAGLIFFGLSWYSNDNGGPKIVFNGPDSVPSGVPFQLELAVSNDSNQVFQDVKISLSLPEGFVFLGKSAEDSLDSRPVGNLGVGSLTKETFNIMALAGGSSNEIYASVDYLPELVGSRFKKEESWSFNLAGSALELEVRAPDKITSGKEVELKVSYLNNSDFDLDNLNLSIEYPPAFQFEKATIKPDSGNNKWSLGGLRRGSSNDFSVFGRLIGPENSFFNFKTEIFTELSGHSYLIAEAVNDVVIQVTPLSLNIEANGVSDYVAHSGEALKYSVNYSYLEQSAGRPKKVSFQVKLRGEMFNLNSGDFKNGIAIRSVDNPASEGDVVFEVRLLDDYPIKRLGDRNFILKAEVQADDGRNVTVADSEIKVAGRLDLTAEAFFRDAASGIVNSGPFPPRVGQATQYTIHWSLINYSNDARSVVVEAVLPSNVEFLSATQNSAGKSPIFQSSNRKVVWEVDRLSATRGIIGSPAEAVFQISATPPLGSDGSYLPLIGEVKLIAIDEFTGLPLSDTAASITTELPHDNTVRGEGRVKVN